MNTDKNTDKIKGLKIISLESCDSTNSYLKSRYEELKADLPVLVTAARQTGGRGRDNRSWVSPAGKGLYSSFGFELDSNRRLFLLPLIAGISVIETLRDIASLEAGLKWPNDILVNGKKIAGVLIENTIFDQRMFCITGIGMNLNHTPADFPPPLTRKAVSLKILTGSTFGAEAVNPLLADRLFHWLEKMETGGGELITRTANDYSRWMEGEMITFHQGPEQIAGGIFRGIHHDGGLILENEAGETALHYSGEII